MIKTSDVKSKNFHLSATLQNPKKKWPLKVSGSSNLKKIEGKRLLKVKNVVLKFGSKTLFDGLNFNVKEGEKIALIGHNGAGKSSLIDIIVGNKKPNQGEVSWNLPSNTTLRSFLGVQLQTQGFPSGLKFRDLLVFYLQMYQLKIGNENVQKLLEEFHIKRLLKSELRRLSGGEKQKVSIVLALLNNPEFTIFDELLTGLDISSQEDVLLRLESYITSKPDLTAIIVSHNTHEIQNIATRVVAMKNGKIEHDLSRKEITEQFKSLDQFISQVTKNEEI